MNAIRTTSQTSALLIKAAAINLGTSPTIIIQGLETTFVFDDPIDAGIVRQYAVKCVKTVTLEHELEDHAARINYVE